MGLLSASNLSEVSPEPASDETLKKFHTPRYLHALKAASRGDIDIDAFHMGIGGPDCPVFKGVYKGAALAVGATLTGADLILKEKTAIAFNPSGGFHHAWPEKAAGFCYLNDNALACIILAEAKKRVLYLDVDVHHGDGVQAAFYDRCDVMTISLHQSGNTIFPGSGFEDEIGTGQGKGFSVNVPLPPGTYDKAYMHAYMEIVDPLIEKFNPDVIVFELGADTLSGDPLAHLSLTNNTYVKIINSILAYNKPILATGGGGYNPESTARAWALAWTVFSGEEADMHHAGMGIGGVLLENTEWAGGLRDRQLPVSEQQQQSVLPQINDTIQKIKNTIFPIHGL